MTNPLDKIIGMISWENRRTVVMIILAATIAGILGAYNFNTMFFSTGIAWKWVISILLVLVMYLAYRRNM